MGHLKFRIPIAGALAAALSLTACSDENPWGNQSEETGCINITLDTNNDVTVAKPLFRSDESETPPTLADYVTYLPKAEDFSIKLAKNDGSYSKTWATLKDFQDDTAEHGNFKTGTYTITAYYGEKGKQTFAEPYLEAQKSFTVLAGQTQDISLTAELKNSMVKVNYTDEFKAYMSEYYSTLRTEGLSDELIFAKDEARAAFIEPVKAELTVIFKTKDHGVSGSLKLGEFAPLAKTLHNITLDITPSSDGNAKLDVKFDDTLDEENITIDLTDELLTTPAPVIECEGFTNGETIDMLEGNGSDVTLKMNVTAKGIIAKAKLIVESEKYTPGWGKEIDLCYATKDQQSQLQTAGISAIGFGFNGDPDKTAYLDLTQYGKNLPTGSHKISLIVEDKTGKVSETASVTLNSEPIALTLVGTPTIVYNSGEAVLTMDYNGADPMTNITFKAINPYGNFEEAPIKACEENTATRAFASKQYIFTITLPTTTKSEIEIKSYYKTTKEMGDYKVPVTVPDYKVSEVDAFSQYAFLKIATTNNDPSTLAAIINNIEFEGNPFTIKDRDASNGIITVTGLTPATTYKNIKSSITGGDSWKTDSFHSFTTETELAIPNGDFSNTQQTINMTDIQVGGAYTGIAFKSPKYYLKSSIVINEPMEWASINQNTCWSSSNNKNTWFCVPSTICENGSVQIRTVGYNHNGTTPDVYNETSAYYCANAPSESQLNKAPGELFLGSYSFDGTEHRSDGIGFASRPSSISFDYSYTPISDGDIGYALIEILDADNNKLGTETFELSESGTKTINFSYSKFGKKAAKLIVSFKSSTQGTSAPINIPTGTALKENGITAFNFTNPPAIDANSYHAVATGSVLTIDNVKATYASEPSATAAKSPASKRKTTKRR